jgi:Tol biopolymer transport system component/DNA-binding winged helix-turn-helix (wHTH) protein
MAASDSRTDRVRFADGELDLRTGELWRDGSRTVLPEQLFRVLAMLVHARGSLVTRDELRQALWVDHTFGDFENGLNAAIKRLREALGDSASAPRFIETIPRRGYRFIAAIDEPSVLPVNQVPRRDYRWVVTAITLAVIVAVAMVVRFFLSAARISPTTHEFIRLTSTSGLNVDPILSPDGLRVAYASDREGTGLDIWIQPVGGGPATRITSDEGDEAEPSFSPDGASIVYAKREAGGIFIVGMGGGSSRALVEVARARTPRFSPDGRWVLYWTGMPLWNQLEGGTPFAAGALEVVASSGGRPRTIAANFPSARYGIWSPSGQQVLFLGEREREDAAGGLDWYLASLEGGAPVRTGALAVLRAAGVTGVPIPGVWTTRDDAVTFASVGEGGSNVWRVRLSRDTGRIVGAPQRLTFGTALERSPAVATSGAIVFASLVENVDVWRVQLDAKSGLGVGSLVRVTDNAASDRAMNVSDDGRRLVFMSSRNGRDTAWIRDLESGTEHQVAREEAFAARISHDGSTVFINQNLPQRRSGLLSAERGTVSWFCRDCQGGDWSQDDRRLLLGRGNPTGLVIRDVRSGDEVPLARHPMWNLFAGRFSPDQRWVAFQTSNTPTLRQIFVVPARAGMVPVEQWIPVVTDFGIQPSWSPDGHAVYHFSYRDGAFCAWLQPLDPQTMRPSGPPRAVQHLHQPRLRAVAVAAVTNDVRGGHLYLTLTETTGNVWLMKPDGKTH